VRTRSGGNRAKIIYRHISVQAGANPAPNPPRYANLVVNGAALPGASTLGVRGSPLVGRFIAGDQIKLAVGGEIFNVIADAVAVSNAAVLTLSGVLPYAVSDGDPIIPIWLNERSIVADIVGLGTRVPDGHIIQTRDLFLTIAANSIPWEPRNGDRITLPSGDVREVVAWTPALVDGVPISYRLQVR
jgi:hypothetical protein